MRLLSAYHVPSAILKLFMHFAFWLSHHHPHKEGTVIFCISQLRKRKHRSVKWGIPVKNKGYKDPPDSQSQNWSHCVMQPSLYFISLPLVPKAAGNRSLSTYPSVHPTPATQSLTCTRLRGCSHGLWPPGTHRAVGDIKRHWINE